MTYDTEDDDHETIILILLAARSRTLRFHNGGWQVQGSPVAFDRADVEDLCEAGYLSKDDATARITEAGLDVLNAYEVEIEFESEFDTWSDEPAKVLH